MFTRDYQCLGTMAGGSQGCPSHPQPRAGQPGPSAGTFLGTEKPRLGCWPRAGVWPWCCTRRAGADGFRDWHGALVPGWMGVSSAAGQSQPTPGVPPVPGWQVSPQSKGTPALLDQQLRARGIILESQKATELSANSIDCSSSHLNLDVLILN